ncbi:hypothetical protein H2248_002277 [Termitomyces sp. 'cryptogamus']|nr:hypothetical protein H2248_002277 [Termitomyces sp. 'cryptogamus']
MPPPKEIWPSGILSVGIEKIQGLAIQKVRKGGNVLLSSVYKARTKIKSNDPFYNSSTEKFIRNWRSTSVRDACIHEAHPLLGVVVLPSKPFSQIAAHPTSPKLLLSVPPQLHPHLFGWKIGTPEILPHVQASLDLSQDLACCQLVSRTTNGREKMDAHTDRGWRPCGKAYNVRMAVTRRYASCLVIEFQKQKHESITGIMPLIVRKSVYVAMAKAEGNWTDDVGENELKPGLSGCHQEVADKDVHIKKVSEHLRCVVESGEVKETDALFDIYERDNSKGEDSDGSSKRTDMETRKKADPD